MLWCEVMDEEGRCISDGSWIIAGFVEDFTFPKGLLQETSGRAGVDIVSTSEMLSRNKQMPQ